MRALEGNTAQLAAEVLFAEKHLTVEVADIASGDVLPPEDYPWAKLERGVLLAGCHSTRNEIAFLAGLVGLHPDRVFRVFAKPYGFMAKGLGTLACREPDMEIRKKVLGTVLPVVPRAIARERQISWRQRRDLLNRFFWRIGQQQQLPEQDEVQRNNRRSVAAAACVLEASGTSVIFPTGHIGSATRGIWRSGIADTLLAVNPARWDDMDVVFFRFRHYRPMRMARAVLLGHALAEHEHAIQLDITQPFAITDILKDHDLRQPGIADMLTEEMRMGYVGFFET